MQESGASDAAGTFTHTYSILWGVRMHAWPFLCHARLPVVQYLSGPSHSRWRLPSAVMIHSFILALFNACTGVALVCHLCMGAGGAPGARAWSVADVPRCGTRRSSDGAPSAAAAASGTSGQSVGGPKTPARARCAHPIWQHGPSRLDDDTIGVPPDCLRRWC